MSARRLAVCGAVAVLLVVAAGVRLHRLGEASLDFDEYLHALTGRAWLEQGMPTLPSGHAYTRALPYTWLVSQSIRTFGTSEAAVRLPSAVFGVVLVFLAGWIAKRWWGNGAAAIVMLLVALDPYCLQMSRVCRMYAPFHFLYIGVLYAAYEALEARWPSRRAWSPTGRARGIRTSAPSGATSRPPSRSCTSVPPTAEGRGAMAGLWWALVATVATMAAVKFHVLIADLWVGVAAFVAIQAVRTRRPFYTRLALLVGLVGFGALVFARPEIDALWRHVNAAPAYAAPWRYDYAFYVRHGWSVDPWLVGLIVPALAWWLWRGQSRGWYLVCAIGMPLALHSIIFDWKEARYLAHIVPVMWLAIGGALWAWVRHLARWLGAHLGLVGRFEVGVAALVGSLVLGPILATSLAAHRLRGLDGEVAKWRETYAALTPLIGSEDQLIISVPLVSAYYADRLPDYIVLNALVRDAGHETQRGPDGLYRDWYSGQPLVTDAAQMAMVLAQHPRGWIVMDQERFVAETCVPAAVRALIEARCRRWPSPDPSIVIYTWGMSS